MKASQIPVLILLILTATLAVAANNISQVKHVIIVIQENRTPDNLFGSDAFASSPQLPGADLVTIAMCKTSCGCTNNQAQLVPFQLDACFDPNHGHDWQAPINNAWVATYNGGNMNGACGTHVTVTQPCNPPTYPQLTYVDNTTGTIQPYFDIAKNWGYANYMFQTNQGPSFEAHQFLFGGTSAPTNPNDSTPCVDTKQHPNQSYPCYKWFAAELQNAPDGEFGCPGLNANIIEVSPYAGAIDELTGIYNNGHPCYNRNTLASLVENNGLTWAYYPQGNYNALEPSPGSSLWTAPNAIQSICGTVVLGQCTGSDWNNYVLPKIPPFPPQAGKMAPILSDIQTCNLPNVSWVIPDGNWSDHPGTVGADLGPSWVANIVNTVGQNGTCKNGETYWNNTVILITWDDWGGFYDHVLPYRCDASGTCNGYPDGNGGQYVYGFRVPLLVVSAYSIKQGYISGACVAQGNCQNEKPPYIHDFGSILNFIEYVFGLGEIDPYGYHYADYWAPDGAVVCGVNCQYPYSLGDFFVDFTKSPQPNPFTPILLPTPYYNAQWFENFGTHHGDPAPSDPDNDAIDQ